jgi:hypothetical protein
MIMQKVYGRNQIPDLRKKTGFMEYLGLEYLDPKSCMVVFFVLMIFVVSVMCVVAYPNTNIPVNM